MLLQLNGRRERGSVSDGDGDRKGKGNGKWEGEIDGKGKGKARTEDASLPQSPPSCSPRFYALAIPLVIRPCQ